MKALLFIFLVYGLSCFAKDKKILIAYFSKSGKTEQLAKSIKEGASQNKKINITLYKINADNKMDVTQFDAIILGSPVYNAQPAPEVISFINSWPFAGSPLKNKIGAVFTTGGGISSGEEAVQLSLMRSMLVFNMVIIGGPDWRQAFGASAITNDGDFKGKKLHKLFLERGVKLGKRVSQFLETTP